MSSSISHSVLWINTAAKVWEDFNGSFSPKDTFRLLDLLDDIQSIKQGNLNVTNYYTNLKILWD